MDSYLAHQHKWDFFIAYSHRDQNTALELYNCIIEKKFRVFLDQTAVELGTYWDKEIPDAQNASWITIALISGNIHESHFGREEVQRGISLARSMPLSHRVIPIYLNGYTEDVPYGLRLIQGIDLSIAGNLDDVSKKLCEALNEFRSSSKDTNAVAKHEGHILLSFPPGPLVNPEMIPRSIIDIYSSLIKESEAKLVVAEANAFRQEANPETNFIIPLNKIPSPDKIPAFNFWMDVFDYARLQGPRMLAALLLTIPDDQFDKKAKHAKTTLLQQLKNHS